MQNIGVSKCLLMLLPPNMFLDDFLQHHCGVPANYQMKQNLMNRKRLLFSTSSLNAWNTTTNSHRIIKLNSIITRVPRAFCSIIKFMFLKWETIEFIHEIAKVFVSHYPHCNNVSFTTIYDHRGLGASSTGIASSTVPFRNHSSI